MYMVLCGSNFSLSVLNPLVLLCGFLLYLTFLELVLAGKDITSSLCSKTSLSKRDIFSAAMKSKLLWADMISWTKQGIPSLCSYSFLPVKEILKM